MFKNFIYLILLYFNAHFQALHAQEVGVYTYSCINDNKQPFLTGNTLEIFIDSFHTLVRITTNHHRQSLNSLQIDPSIPVKNEILVGFYPSLADGILKYGSVLLSPGALHSGLSFVSSRWAPYFALATGILVFSFIPVSASITYENEYLEEDLKNLPHTCVFLTAQQIEQVLSYLEEMGAQIEKGDKKYSVAGFNCIDFTQGVYEATGEKNYFITAFAEGPWKELYFAAIWSHYRQEGLRGVVTHLLDVCHKRATGQAKIIKTWLDMNCPFDSRVVSRLQRVLH